MIFAASFLVVLNLALMLIFYFKISKKFSQNAYQKQMKRDVNRLIGDIQRESDNAITLLEHKIQRIEKLLADTDKHLLFVENAHQKWEQQQHFLTPSHKKPQESSTLLQSGYSMQNKYVPHTEQKNTSSNIKTDSITIYTKKMAETHSTPRNTVAVLSPREQVIDYARKGLSLDFIASKVDLPLGEIELILSMQS